MLPDQDRQCGERHRLPQGGRGRPPASSPLRSDRRLTSRRRARRAIRSSTCGTAAKANSPSSSSTPPTHQCLGGALKTGSTGPYPATYKQVGKYLQFTVKTPNYINYPVPGLVGSLESEQLTYFKRTRKVHGKTVAITSSIGCKGNTRAYSATFTTTLPPAGPATETDTVSKKAALLRGPAGDAAAGPGFSCWWTRPCPCPSRSEAIPNPPRTKH